MKLTPLLAALSLWAAAAPALAQGTEAQRAACGPDAFRLCASHIPNVGAITACLRSERSRLSSACRTAMDEAAPPARAAEARPAPSSVTAGRLPARQAARAEARPPARRSAAASAPPRVTVRQVGRVRVVTRTVVIYRDRPRRAATRRRNGPGYDGQMAQAAYWMQRIGGMSERFGGPSIAGMMGMLQ